MSAPELIEPAPTARTRGVPIEHWIALSTFAGSPAERELRHGTTGKGHNGEPSPFADLARHVSGWRYLKLWDIKHDIRGNVVDAGGRFIIPSECFDVFVYAAALEAYSKHDQLDGRISPSAIVDALISANISPGVPLGLSGGRPPIFSLSVADVVGLLPLDAGRGLVGASGTSWNTSCSIDAALEYIASSRTRVAQAPLLRRFLSHIPPEWPTVANDGEGAMFGVPCPVKRPAINTLAQLLRPQL